MSEHLFDLIILRHGEAADADIDRNRTLTERGQQQIHSQYQWLKQQGLEPQLILHSPYQRTVETASLSANYFPDTELQTEPLITPDGDPAMVISMLSAVDQQQIIVVSHMPMVCYLTAELLPAINIFSYPIAGLCWLQITRDGSTAELLHQHWCEM